MLVPVVQHKVSCLPKTDRYENTNGLYIAMDIGGQTFEYSRDSRSVAHHSGLARIPSTNLLSIDGLRNGITLQSGQRDVQLRRPRFGYRVSDRDLLVDGVGIAWQLGLTRRLSYWCYDRGAQKRIAEGNSRSISVDGDLDPERTCLLLVLFLEGVPRTSYWVWRISHAI